MTAPAIGPALEPPSSSFFEDLSESADGKPEDRVLEEDVALELEVDVVLEVEEVEDDDDVEVELVDVSSDVEVLSEEEVSLVEVSRGIAVSITELLMKICVVCLKGYEAYRAHELWWLTR